MTAENTARKQRGKPFRKGQSGNPRGRPQGARNAATMLAERLLDGEAEALIRKAIEQAKDGNTVALRLCLERIVPPRRDRALNFTIPDLNSAVDACKAMAAIAQAVARGELGVSEAGELSKLIDTYVRAIEATELERRLLALEQRFK